MTENTGLWLDLIGPVVDANVYKNGVLAVKGATVTLPAVTPKTAEFAVMGTANYPIPCSFDDMEATVKKKGTGKELRELCAQEFMDIEIRYAQDVKTNTGVSRIMPCKAFLRVFPKVAMPSISIEPGNIIEPEITYAVSRYQLFQDGEEALLIDRFNNIARFLGKDYAADLRAAL